MVEVHELLLVGSFAVSLATCGTDRGPILKSQAPASKLTPYGEAKVSCNTSFLEPKGAVWRRWVRRVAHHPPVPGS